MIQFVCVVFLVLNPFKNRIDFFHVCISMTSDHTENVTFLLLLFLQTCLSVLSSVGILIESPFEISSASGVLNTNF